MPRVFIHIYIVILFIVSPITMGHANSNDFYPPLRTINYSSDMGLSNNQVYSIVEGPQGFIWLGTANGLNRFNGYNFEVFRNDPNIEFSLANNVARKLFLDNAGTLWIGSRRLQTYNKEKDRFATFEVKNYDTLLTTYFGAIYQTDDDHMWFGTRGTGQGLFEYNPETEEFTQYLYDPNDTTSLAHNYITCITEDHQGNLWIGTRYAGLEMLDRSKGTFKHFPKSVKNNNGPNSSYIHNIYQDKQDNLWLGTNNGGLNRYDYASGKFEYYVPPTSMKVRGLLEDRDSIFWVGTMDGLYIFDRTEKQFHQYAHTSKKTAKLNHNSVFSIFESSTGQLWLGSYAGGIHLLDKSQKRFFSTTAGCESYALSNKLVTSFAAERDGDMWLGSEGGGVNFYNATTENISQEFSKENIGADIVNALILENNILWIGTHTHGLVKVNTKSGKIRNFKKATNSNNDAPENTINCMLQDKQGRFWLGLASGLALFDKQTGEFEYFYHDPSDPSTIAKGYVNDIYKSSSGEIWIGTEKGLSKLNPDGKSFTNYIVSEQNESYSESEVNVIHEDKQGRIWVGTGLGLYFLKTDKAFKKVENDYLLGKESIMGILEDENGKLWISSLKGLFKFDPATYETSQYTVKDGIQSNEFNQGAYYKNPYTEEFFFGGVSGFTQFYPSQIEKNTTPPRVRLTSLKIFNEEVTPGDENDILQSQISTVDQVNLSHKHSVVTIDYVAINYTQSLENKYAYKLENFDDEWNYVDETRSATYTNLEPGSYTFKVKAANNDGYWSEKPASLSIIIPPPFWQTSWFRIMSILLLSSMIFFIYKARIRVLKRRNVNLQHIVADRTSEIRDKNKELEKNRSQLEKQYTIIETQNNKLKAYNQSLEAEVEKRTNELSTANKELVRHNNILEQFAFITAHNIKSPVARLKGLTEVFDYENLENESNPQILKHIHDSAVNLDEVIKDINKILEVQKGAEPEKTEVDLEEVINKISNTFNQQITQHNIQITTNLHVKKIVSVKPYLESILYNLISNAIKYKNLKDQPKITIKSEQGNDFVFLQVIDNGLGMDLQNNKNKLFGLYQRFHTHIEGKGLGLHLVKMQIEALKGEVNVDSEVNKGTHFTIKLPIYPKS